MEGLEQAIEQLRLAVECKAGRKMQTNKDFDCLSDSVYDQTHAKISTTTLKRIWGYLSEGVTPRRYTLDQLARFIGYDDFDAFSASLETDKAPESDNSNVGTGFTPRPQEGTTTEEAPSAVPSFGKEGSEESRGLLPLYGRRLGWGSFFFPPLPCCFSCSALPSAPLPTTTAF